MNRPNRIIHPVKALRLLVPGLTREQLREEHLALAQTLDRKNRRNAHVSPNSEVLMPIATLQSTLTIVALFRTQTRDALLREFPYISERQWRRWLPMTAGCSVEEFANLLGIGKRSLEKLEAGELDLERRLADRIFALTGVTPGELMNQCKACTLHSGPLRPHHLWAALDQLPSMRSRQAYNICTFAHWNHRSRPLVNPVDFNFEEIDFLLQILFFSALKEQRSDRKHRLMMAAKLRVLSHSLYAWLHESSSEFGLIPNIKAVLRELRSTPSFKNLAGPLRSFEFIAHPPEPHSRIEYFPGPVETESLLGPGWNEAMRQTEHIKTKMVSQGSQGPAFTEVPYPFTPPEPSLLHAYYKLPEKMAWLYHKPTEQTKAALQKLIADWVSEAEKSAKTKRKRTAKPNPAVQKKELVKGPNDTLEQP